MLAEWIPAADAVFHLAATVGVFNIIARPVATIKNNVGTTSAVLEAAARRKTKVVLTSTSEVYGKSSVRTFQEEGDLVLGPTSKFRWSYAASKIVDEFLALAFWQEFRLPAVVVRLFNTIGPRQTGRYGMVVPRFLSQAHRGENLTVYGDGQQTRCFTYVADVVEWLLRLATDERAVGQVFNLGNPREISILGLAERVIAVTRAAVSIDLVPYEKATPRVSKTCRRRVPDVGRVTALTGYRPSVNLDEALCRTWEWLVASGRLPGVARVSTPEPGPWDPVAPTAAGDRSGRGRSAGCCRRPWPVSRTTRIGRSCANWEAWPCAAEMISARGFLHLDVRIHEFPERLWGVREEPRPLAVQIWDNDPENLAAVGQRLAEEFRVSVVDLNFGCPVKDVSEKAKSGSYLLRHPDRVGAIVARVVRACHPTPVTAKIRLGCTRDTINAVDVAQAVEGAGGAAVTVHGRTASEMFRGQADWDEIAAIRPHLRRIPLVGNGDLTTPESVVRAFRRYDPDGVMIGRGALSRPWLFRQVQAALAGEPVPSEPTLGQQREMLLGITV